MILGLTGGMGCGKSTAARIFQQQGFRLFDADDCVRTRILTDPEVITAIATRLPHVIDRDGRVVRSQLAAAVFTEERLLAWLESLTHPLVYNHWRAAIAAEPTADWVSEVPLLFEKGLENWFDFTLCVITTPYLQRVRLRERGVTPELAEQRISKQWPLAAKSAQSDFVFTNDGHLESLVRQIKLWISLHTENGPTTTSTQS